MLMVMVLCASVLGAPSYAAADVVGDERSTIRLAGSDRYQTAVTVSQWAFPAGAPVVYIATGTDFADALSAAPAAAAAGGPLLLVPEVGITTEVWDEIVRLAPTEIFVVGGAGVVPPATEARLAGLTSTTRLSGPDRFGTAAAIALASHPTGAAHVVIATGFDFADALAGGPAAASVDAPILLTWNDELAQATIDALDALAPDSITILGGTSAVSEEVETALSAWAPVQRFAGADRYSTAVATASGFFTSADAVFVSNGTGFADALAGGAAAAMAGMPLLLVSPTAPPTVAVAEIERLGASTVYVLGGTGVVPTWTEEWLAGVESPLACATGAPSSPTGAVSTVPGVGAPTVDPPTRRYLVQVENGLPVDSGCFAASVEAVLNHPDGWSRTGKVSFQRVDAAPYDFRVILASPNTTDALCAPIGTGGIYSCRNGERVVLNHWRWVVGATDFGTDLTTYRFYLVNHEVGHALSMGHRSCPVSGAPAPVMMQQTKTTGSCVPNGFPTDAELASLP